MGAGSGLFPVGAPNRLTAQFHVIPPKLPPAGSASLARTVVPGDTDRSTPRLARHAHDPPGRQEVGSRRTHGDVGGLGSVPAVLPQRRQRVEREQQEDGGGEADDRLSADVLLGSVEQLFGLKRLGYAAGISCHGHQATSSPISRDVVTGFIGSGAKIAIAGNIRIDQACQAKSENFCAKSVGGRRSSSERYGVGKVRLL